MKAALLVLHPVLLIGALVALLAFLWSRSWVALYISVVLVTYLTVLNGYLRGAWKARIGLGLGLFWIFAVGCGFVLLGWKAGVIAFISSFVYGWATWPVAAMVSRRVLGYRTACASERGSYSGVSPSTADLLSRRISTEEWLRRGQHEAAERSRRIHALARKSEIARVLAEKGKTEADLDGVFWCLHALGLGEQAWQIMSRPIELKLVLEMQDGQVSLSEVLERLMG